MIVISDPELDDFLREDLPYGDLTTRTLGLGGRPASMVFRARKAMVASSTEEAARLLTRLGCRVELRAASGRAAEEREILLEAQGPAEAILAGWKVAQTLVEYASGIASAAARIVAAARQGRPGAVVACTRKVFPGTKAVAIKAILAGGAVPHRLGLSDSVLLFPEHRALLADLPLEAQIARLKAGCPEKKVVIEVTDVGQAMEAARAGADVVQLEKFSPDAVAQVVAGVAPLGLTVAAAGGIGAANARDYAAAGAHILVTSAPYSAPPADVAVAIGPA